MNSQVLIKSRVKIGSWKSDLGFEIVYNDQYLNEYSKNNFGPLGTIFLNLCSNKDAILLQNKKANFRIKQ